METISDAMEFLESVINELNTKETVGLYIDLINNYLERAYIPELEADASDLYCYVVELMKNPIIQVMVFSNPLMAIVFRQTTLRFITSMIHQNRFQRQRLSWMAQEIKSTYRYAPNKRGSEWKSLVSKVSEQLEDYGFDKHFMENLLEDGGALEPQKWNKLIIDWATALQRKIAHKEAKNASKSQSIRPDEYMFERIEKDMMNYLNSSTMSDMEANEQTLNLMHGQWNRSEYERLRPIISRQKRYPMIEKVVNKMGRIADDDGKRRIAVASGNTMNITHSSGSDIEGITTSNELTGLLPSELALFASERLSDVFWHKYMTSQLQTFRYKSNIVKPTRKLTNTIKAKNKGPMIVCVDTSSSMNGEPIMIAQSILSRVLWMANKQKRRCYLIYYSVQITTIDLQLDNWQITDLKTTPYGGTDATQMLNEIFRLLSSEQNYMYADVLWISDFIVPQVDISIYAQLDEFRKSDTHFYGYKIGGSDTYWEKYLDKIYVHA